MSVRPGRAAVGAGSLVAICVAVLFCVRTVPDRVVSLVGGPSGGVARWGGLRVRYQPPAGSDTAIETYLRERGDQVERQGDGLLLEFPGVAEDTVANVIDVLIAGGLSMKLALEDDWAARIASDNPLVNTESRPDPDDPRARLETDYWIGEEDGSRHSTLFLMADSRAPIEAAIRAQGFQIPAGQEIAYEDLEPLEGARNPRSYVRAYLLASEVLISGTMIESALGSFDPNTGRPVVLFDLDSQGADLFCDLTRRIAGKKLALVLGGKVRSAPVINGAICGGRASITMGGHDADRQLRERDAIVEVLRHGALPTGGTILERGWTPAPDLFLQVLLGRLLLGLLAGLVTALITFTAVRFARPTIAARTHGFTGPFPWKRLAVTALAPLVLIIGKRLTLPGINESELDHVTRGASTEFASVIALGLGPILVAYFLVEVVALAIPPLRWRRHDPGGRIALGRVAAVLAIAISLAYGYFVARSMESLSASGAEIVFDNSGWRFRLILMISVTAGSLLLAIVAGLISEHGLGNGYGVLAVTAVVLDIIPDLDFVDPFTAEYALGLVVFAAIVTAATFVLRWRVTEARQPALRLPTSGMSPLADSGAFIGLMFSITGVASSTLMFDLMIKAQVLSDEKVRFAIVVISLPIWAWIFARPSVVERVALQSGLERPTTATWLRATAVSALLVLGAAMLTNFVQLDAPLRVLVNPVSALMFAAVLLDVIADARARCSKLAVAGVVHQPQYLGAIEHTLAEASIPYHSHASHLRSLLAFFGPWAPIHVLVSEDHAIEARLKIDGVLRSSRGTVPEARAVQSGREGPRSGARIPSE